jgi:hypothetical protein
MPTIVTAAAITSAIALTTIWSTSMLPRHRDVLATVQTSGPAGLLANPTLPLLR